LVEGVSADIRSHAKRFFDVGRVAVRDRCGGLSAGKINEFSHLGK